MIWGSFLEKTVESRKHLGEARRMKKCPRGREIANTVLKEKRSHMWWGYEVVSAISFLFF